METINRAQKKDGTLSDLQECSYKGVTYFRRIEPRQTNYYAIRGPVLLFTSQEKVRLQQAIDVDQKATDAEPPLAHRLREIGADRAALALWVNPRAFDASLEAKAAAAGTDAALQKKVLTYWKATDGVAAWATLDTDLRLSLAVRVRPDALPPAARRLLATAALPSEAWRFFPDDALLACGSRIDAGALVEMLQDLQPKDERCRRQRPPRQGLCQGPAVPRRPGLGFVHHRSCGRRQGLAAASAAGGARHAGRRAAPVDEALLAGVDFAASWAILAYNHDHPTAAESQVGGV